MGIELKAINHAKPRFFSLVEHSISNKNAVCKGGNENFVDQSTINQSNARVKGLFSVTTFASQCGFGVVFLKKDLMHTTAGESGHKKNLSPVNRKEAAWNEINTCACERLLPSSYA